MNQHGSITISFLVLLPLLTAVLVVTSAAYVVLSADTRMRHTCRTELLEAQSKVAEHINALLAMNPTARILRARLKLAKAKAALTVGTPAHAAAMLELQLVMRLQFILALQQKSRFTQARLISKLAPAKTSIRVRGKIQSFRNHLHETPASLGGWRSFSKPANLKMTISPKNSLTPDYETAPGFADSQIMQVSWSLKTAALLPNWMRRFLVNQNLEIRGSCSATLKKENNKWQASLTHEGKPSSSFSSLLRH